MFSLYIVNIELFVSKRLWHMTHLFSKYSGVIEHEGKHILIGFFFYETRIYLTVDPWLMNGD
jgi:hypothetical protein